MNQNNSTSPLISKSYSNFNNNHLNNKQFKNNHNYSTSNLIKQENNNHTQNTQIKQDSILKESINTTSIQNNKSDEFKFKDILSAREQEIEWLKQKLNEQQKNEIQKIKRAEIDQNNQFQIKIDEMVANHEYEKIRLNNEIQTLQQALATNQIEIESLNKKNQFLNSINRNLTEEIDNCKDKNFTLEKDLNLIRNDTTFKVKKETENQFLELINKFQKEKEAIFTQIQIKSAESKEMSFQIENFTLENSKLKLSILEQEKIMAELLLEVKQQNVNLQKSEETFGLQMNEMQVQMQNQQIHHENITKQLKLKIENLDLENSGQQNQIISLDDQNQRLLNQIQIMKIQMNNDTKNFEEKLFIANSKINQFENEEIQKNIEIENLNLEKKCALDDLDHTSKQISIISQQFSNQIKQLTKDNQTLFNSKNSLEEHLTLLQKAKEKLDQCLNEKNKKLSELENLNSDLSEKLIILTNQVNDLQDNTIKQQNEINELNEELNHFENITNYQQDLKIAMETEKEILIQKIDQLTNQIEELLSEQELSQCKQKQQSMELEEKESQLNKQKYQMNQMIQLDIYEQLQKNQKNLNLEFQKCQQKLDETLSQLKQKEEGELNLNQQLTDLTNSLQNESLFNNKQQIEKEELLVQIDSSKNEIQQNQQSHKEIENQYKCIQNQNSILLSENQNLQGKIEQLKKQLQISEATILHQNEQFIQQIKDLEIPITKQLQETTIKTCRTNRLQRQNSEQISLPQL